MKFQAPTSKLQRSSKHQAPMVAAPRCRAWSLMLLWMLVLGAWHFPATAAPKNILLIIADDYGVDSSSLYNSTANGATLPPTPNIQSLATNAVATTNGSTVTLKDATPPTGKAFYSVVK